MPTLYNPFTGELEISGAQSGGGASDPVKITTDDGISATSATNSLRLAGLTGIATTSNGNQVGVQVTGAVALSFVTDDANAAAPKNNTLNVQGNPASGISTTGTPNGIQVVAATATSSQKGVASYNPQQFTLNSGQVSANLATGTAAGIASFDTGAFGISNAGRVTLIPLNVNTDSGQVTASAGTIALHGTTGLNISGTGATVTLAPQPATSSALGNVIPGSAFTVDASGNLSLNPVTPALGGTGLVNPSAQQVPITNGSSTYTLAQLQSGQVLGGGNSNEAKPMTLLGQNGLNVNTDDNFIYLQNLATLSWHTYTAGLPGYQLSNGTASILGGTGGYQITPVYDATWYQIPVLKLIGAGDTPLTITPANFYGTPDILIINGQTATNQIQGVETWASCDVVLIHSSTDTHPVRTWMIMPLSGNFTVS